MELKGGLGRQRKGFNYRFVKHILTTASAADFDDCGCCHFFSPRKREGKIRCVWILFSGEDIVFLLLVLWTPALLLLLVIIQSSEKQRFLAFCPSQWFQCQNNLYCPSLNSIKCAGYVCVHATIYIYLYIIHTICIYNLQYGACSL